MSLRPRCMIRIEVWHLTSAMKNLRSSFLFGRITVEAKASDEKVIETKSIKPARLGFWNPYNDAYLKDRRRRIRRY